MKAFEASFESKSPSTTRWTSGSWSSGWSGAWRFGPGIWWSGSGSWGEWLACVWRSACACAAAVVPATVGCTGLCTVYGSAGLEGEGVQGKPNEAEAGPAGVPHNVRGGKQSVRYGQGSFGWDGRGDSRWRWAPDPGRLTVRGHGRRRRRGQGSHKKGWRGACWRVTRARGQGDGGRGSQAYGTGRQRCGDGVRRWWRCQGKGDRGEGAGKVVWSSWFSKGFFLSSAAWSRGGGKPP